MFNKVLSAFQHIYFPNNRFPIRAEACKNPVESISPLFCTLAPIIWWRWITHMFNWNHNPSVYLLHWGYCNILPVHCQSSYGTLVFVMLCFNVLKNSNLFVVSWCIGIPPSLLPYPLHRHRIQVACVHFSELSSLTLRFSCLLGKCRLSETCEKVNWFSGFYHISSLHLRNTDLDVKM